MHTVVPCQGQQYQVHIVANICSNEQQCGADPLAKTRRRTSKPPLMAQPITSARGTVIAAEVAVKNMYHEERELLPAADGTHGKEGLLPGAGGMSSPPGPGSSLFYWRR